MQKTLARDSDRGEIARRIAHLTPASQRQWGSMSVGGMICHLYDGYRLGMGETTAEPVRMPLPKPIMKRLSLRLSAPWPKNLKTVEEVRQGGAGTPAGDFAEDRARLLSSFDRFCACTQHAQTHPMFGPMLREDWLRWGYLHADHHLRQFGV